MDPKSTGQYIGKKMSGKKLTLTKREMLAKWPTLASTQEIGHGIDWIEANLTLSNNPFLVVPVNGEWKWGFRDSFGTVSANLKFQFGYILTRLETQERVLTHSINSPVVNMTMAEKRAAKAVLAQTGGTIAFLHNMIHALP